MAAGTPDASMGTLAALAAPLSMAIGFVLWDKWWKGSAFSLNLFKAWISSAGFGVVVLAGASRMISPGGGAGATALDQRMLVLSGFVGIVVGDQAWLLAMQRIGARRVIVVDVIKPFVAALLAVPLLGEPLRWGVALGMCVTLAGILVVSLERTDGADGAGADDGVDDDRGDGRDGDGDGDGVGDGTGAAAATAAVDIELEVAGLEMVVVRDDGAVDDDSPPPAQPPPAQPPPQQPQPQPRPRRGTLARGYLWSALNVALDVYGAILTKQHGAGLSTWDICLIRFGSSAVILLAFSLAARAFYAGRRRHATGGARMVARARVPGEDAAAAAAGAAADPGRWARLPALGAEGYAWIVGATALATFACTALQNYAIFQINLATFSTLLSLTPIFALPCVWLLKGERVTARAVIGSIVAVAGIVPLYYFETGGEGGLALLDSKP